MIYNYIDCFVRNPGNQWFITILIVLSGILVINVLSFITILIVLSGILVSNVNPGKQWFITILIVLSGILVINDL